MRIFEAAELINISLYSKKIERSVDMFVAGDPDKELTGISTTFLATSEVINRSKSAGCNLVITHEPVFYNHNDDVGWLESNIDYKRKIKLINDAGESRCSGYMTTSIKNHQTRFCLLSRRDSVGTSTRIALITGYLIYRKQNWPNC